MTIISSSEITSSDLWFKSVPVSVNQHVAAVEPSSTYFGGSSMTNNRYYGFTLLELLIAIAIITILAIAFIPVIVNVRKQSYDSGARACGKSIQTAQAISQNDNKTYLIIGAGDDQLNLRSDAINSMCGDINMYLNDRSDSSNITSTYTIDIWDSRGGSVFTITPSFFQKNSPGATPFSTNGSGGSNMPQQ